MRNLVVTENMTVDGVIDMAAGWFDPLAEDIDQSDITVDTASLASSPPPPSMRTPSPWTRRRGALAPSCRFGAAEIRANCASGRA
jgi:hypothetical protein